jgi:hypothetical protein
MDFEWTNQTGPIDSQSPFLAASQQKKRKLPDPPFAFIAPLQTEQYLISRPISG